MRWDKERRFDVGRFDNRYEGRFDGRYEERRVSDDTTTRFDDRRVSDERRFDNRRISGERRLEERRKEDRLISAEHKFDDNRRVSEELKNDRDHDIFDDKPKFREAIAHTREASREPPYREYRPRSGSPSYSKSEIRRESSSPNIHASRTFEKIEPTKETVREGMQGEKDTMNEKESQVEPHFESQTVEPEKMPTQPEEHQVATVELEKGSLRREDHPPATVNHVETSKSLAPNNEDGQEKPSGQTIPVESIPAAPTDTKKVPHEEGPVVAHDVEVLTAPLQADSRKVTPSEAALKNEPVADNDTRAVIRNGSTTFDRSSESEYEPQLTPLNQEPSRKKLIKINGDVKSAPDTSAADHASQLEAELVKVENMDPAERRSQMKYLRQVKDSGSFKFLQADIKRHKLLKDKISSLVTAAVKNLEQQKDRLAVEYRYISKEWQEFCNAAEEEFKQRETLWNSSNSSATINGNGLRSDTASVVGQETMGNAATHTTVSGITATHAGVSRRGRSTFQGDSVRSEAEFLEILAKLERENARDPSVRAQLTSAKVPNMIFDPVERDKFRFIDHNNLIVDKSIPYKRLFTDSVDSFTPEEHEIFCDAYVMYPKQFGKIASVMGGRKTFHDCVLHYYQTKYKVDYKQLILNRNRRTARKARKNAIREKMVESEESTAPTPVTTSEAICTTTVPATVAAPEVPSLSSPFDALAMVASLVMREETGKKRKQGDDGSEMKKRSRTMKRGSKKAKQIEGQQQSNQPNASSSSPGSVPQVSAVEPKEKVSSYWSLVEVGQFERLMEVFGSNWEEIAKQMKFKTAVMLKNYYLKHATERGYDLLIAQVQKRLGYASQQMPRVMSNMHTIVDPKVQNVHSLQNVQPNIQPNIQPYQPLNVQSNAGNQLQQQVIRMSAPGSHVGMQQQQVSHVPPATQAPQQHLKVLQLSVNPMNSPGRGPLPGYFAPRSRPTQVLGVTQGLGEPYGGPSIQGRSTQGQDLQSQNIQGLSIQSQPQISQIETFGRPGTYSQSPPSERQRLPEPERLPSIIKSYGGTDLYHHAPRPVLHASRKSTIASILNGPAPEIKREDESRHSLLPPLDSDRWNRGLPQPGLPQPQQPQPGTSAFPQPLGPPPLSLSLSPPPFGLAEARNPYYASDQLTQTSLYDYQPAQRESNERGR